MSSPIHISVPSSTKKTSPPPTHTRPLSSRIYMEKGGNKNYYHTPTALSITRYITTSSSGLVHSPHPRTSTGAACKAHTSKPPLIRGGIALPHIKNPLSSKGPPHSPAHIPKSKIACALVNPKHHPFPKRTERFFPPNSLIAWLVVLMFPLNAVRPIDRVSGLVSQLNPECEKISTSSP